MVKYRIYTEIYNTKCTESVRIPKSKTWGSLIYRLRIKSCKFCKSCPKRKKSSTHFSRNSGHAFQISTAQNP